MGTAAEPRVPRGLLRGCLVALFALSLVSLGDGAFDRGQTVLTASNSFLYATKFGCDRGTCRYKFRAGLRRPWEWLQGVGMWKGAGRGGDDRLHQALQNAAKMSVGLRVFLDEDWEKLSLGEDPCRLVGKARIHKTINMPLDGSVSEWTEGAVHQHVRPHMWYFVVEDCDNRVLEELAQISGVRAEELRGVSMQWVSEIFQVDGSHFSYEYLGSIRNCILHIVGYTLLLWRYMTSQCREIKRAGSLHILGQMLNVCLLSQLTSSLLHFAHLFAYAYNGMGIRFLDGVAEVLAVFSQITLSSLLICVAYGYSLNVPPKVRQSDSSIFLVVALNTAIHLLLTVLDVYNADTRFRFHTQDGSMGVVFTVLRVAVWAWFLFSVQQTTRNEETLTPVQNFLWKFSVPASVYFLAYPTIYGVTCFFAHYLQHVVLSNLVFVMQFSSLIWLGRLFLTRGEYFSVSVMSRGLLPGGFLSAGGIHRLD